MAKYRSIKKSTLKKIPVNIALLLILICALCAICKN